jgi:hypothetical protein
VIPGTPVGTADTEVVCDIRSVFVAIFSRSHLPGCHALGRPVLSCQQKNANVSPRVRLRLGRIDRSRPLPKRPPNADGRTLHCIALNTDNYPVRHRVISIWASSAILIAERCPPNRLTMNSACADVSRCGRSLVSQCSEIPDLQLRYSLNPREARFKSGFSLAGAFANSRTSRIQLPSEYQLSTRTVPRQPASEYFIPMYFGEACPAGHRVQTLVRKH